MILLWATLKGEPRNWALQAENWSVRPRPRHLLSEGQLSRRAAKQEVEAALKRILWQIAAEFSDDSTLAIVDGSPLLVGASSKDPNAKAGRATKGFGRGYKLHLVMSDAGCIHSLRVTSLNANEGKQLGEMATEIPDRVTRVLADGSYDSSSLHQQLDEHRIRLIAPLRRGRVGRRQNPFRLAVERYLRSPMGKHVFKKRGNIERFFGHFKSHRLGLQHLPSWVRTLKRVRLWVLGKLICWLTAKSIPKEIPP